MKKGYHWDSWEDVQCCAECGEPTMAACFGCADHPVKIALCMECMHDSCGNVDCNCDEVSINGY